MYNEEDNHIDELFRSTFAGHEETPPPAAWNNIVETRSFGHVLLNQIALNWKNFLFMTIGFMFVGAAVIGFGSTQSEQENSHTYQTSAEQLYGGHDFGGMLLADNATNGRSNNGARSYYGQAMPSPFGQYKAIQNRINHSTNLLANEPIASSSHNKSVGPYHLTTDDAEERLSVDHSTQLINRRSAVKIGPKKVNNNTAEAEQNAEPVPFTTEWSKKAAPQRTFAEAIKHEEAFSTKALLGHIAALKPFNIKKVSRTNAATPIAIDSLYYNAETKKRFSLKNHLYLSFQMGPQFMNKELSAMQSENNTYLNKRNQSEETAIGGSLQANLTYYFFNNVFIETGVRYSRFNERLTYSETNVTSQQTVFDSIVTGFTVGPTGEPVPIYDITSRTVYETEVSNIEQNNTYHMVDIPLLIGYQVDLQRWSVYLKSGITPTVFQKQSGYVLGEGESSRLDFGGNDDPYHSGMILNLELAGGVSYQLDETIHLLVEPSFRSNISSLYKGDFPLTEKRKILGISAGIRIKL